MINVNIVIFLLALLLVVYTIAASMGLLSNIRLSGFGSNVLVPYTVQHYVSHYVTDQRKSEFNL
jgi:hypothetical protein